jgi:hypothetical protein
MFLKLHLEVLLQVLHNFDAFWHKLFQEGNTTILHLMIIELLQVISYHLMEAYHLLRFYMVFLTCKGLIQIYLLHHIFFM